MNARKKLWQLPDDPDAIADLLHEQGLTGTPGDARDCPLSNYLGKGWIVGLTAASYNNLLISRRITLPPAALRFRTRFDASWYPQLYNDEFKARRAQWPPLPEWSYAP